MTTGKLFDERPVMPEPGDDFTMPDGTVVKVSSTAQDHTGIRVNEITVWRPWDDAPADPPR